MGSSRLIGHCKSLTRAPNDYRGKCSGPAGATADTLEEDVPDFRERALLVAAGVGLLEVQAEQDEVGLERVSFAEETEEAGPEPGERKEEEEKQDDEEVEDKIEEEIEEEIKEEIEEVEDDEEEEEVKEGQEVEEVVEEEVVVVEEVKEVEVEE